MPFRFEDNRCKCPYCKKKINIILIPKGMIFYDENLLIRPEYNLFCLNTNLELEKDGKKRVK